MGSAIPERWVFYALGGGLGHVTRSVSLARAVSRPRGTRRSLEIRLITNSPYAACVPVANELQEASTLHLEVIDSTWDRDQVAGCVTRFLETSPPDVLVVDVFPRGLAGELKPLLSRLSCRKVLVHRDLSPKYVEQYDIASAVDQYDLILVPGEAAPFEDSPRAVITPPWLMRDADELLPPEEARRRLGVETDLLPVVAVMGCGRVEEAEQMREIASDLQREFSGEAEVRLVTLDVAEEGTERAVTVQLWPFLQVIRGVDVVVGSGGYNTVHEMRSTGTPLVALPRPRLYDRQERRLQDSELVVDPEQIGEKVRAVLKGRTVPRPIPTYINGVHQALEQITNGT